jgi:prepilin-type N-terminal cleavage/methylation domain-containing protein
MTRKQFQRGFSLMELLVIIAILGIVIAMLLPAVQAARESARRAACMNNLAKLGRAFFNHEAAKRQFPMASTVTRDAAGKITAVDGWSFTVMLLPYLEQATLFESLDIKNGRPLVERPGAKDTPHATVLALSLPEFRCPSFGGEPFADPLTKKEALTNYKAMGATHVESLTVASPKPLKPKYKPEGQHPDGGCFPGTALKLTDIKDGASNTILLVETVEPRFARWTVGAEATLVGLPPSVEYEQVKGKSYFAPKGPDARTYLNWDYDQHPYDGADGTKGGKYGPSSNHRGTVNHVFFDGHIEALNRSVDASLYMFHITRDAGDPIQ